MCTFVAGVESVFASTAPVMLCSVVSVLQCAAVCYSVLQCVAVGCRALQCVAVCGSV